MKKTTMANKARLIRDTLHLSDFDSEFMRRDLVEASPLAWRSRMDSRGLPPLSRPEGASSNHASRMEAILAVT